MIQIPVLPIQSNGTLPVLANSDEFVFADHTVTLTNKTLTAPIINNPKINIIEDSNGNNYIDFVSATNAVNYLQIENAATGSHPTISAVGSDPNLNLELSAKGSGTTFFKSPISHCPATQTASGAVIMTKPLTIFNNGSPLAMTLANGFVAGQVKKFMNKNTGAVTITPTNFANGTSFTILQNGVTEAVWDGTKWYLAIDKNWSSSDGTLVYVTT